MCEHICKNKQNFAAVEKYKMARKLTKIFHSLGKPHLGPGYFLLHLKECMLETVILLAGARVPLELMTQMKVTKVVVVGIRIFLVRIFYFYFIFTLKYSISYFMNSNIATYIYLFD